MHCPKCLSPELNVQTIYYDALRSTHVIGHEYECKICKFVFMVYGEESK